MSERREVDVAVIGAGSAGLGARRVAAKEGASTLLIEAERYGTTCARVGCMPSKLLIAAAEAAHDMQRAGVFGVHAPGGPQIDGKAVMARVRHERDMFVGSVVRATEAIDDESRLMGRARFVGPTTLMVDDHTRVEAGAVVIATGSSVWVPPPLRAVEDQLLTNEDIFDLDDIPASVAVVGLGVIGLELGQALHRLGAEVVFFELGERIGPITDPEVRACAHAVLGDELTLHLGVGIESAVAVEGGVELRWKDGGQPHAKVFERVLAATGRRPNVGGLGLDAAGIELDERGVPIYDARSMRCGKSAVFIAGDVDNARPLLHEASDEGRIAGRNAALLVRNGSDAPRAFLRRTPLTVVFTDPQIALVGQTHAELEGSAIAIGQVDYDDQGRAKVMAVNAGRVRIYGDATDGRLLGAELFGPRVEHTGHLLAWAIQSRMTVLDALSMPFYHPCVEEGIRTALRDLAAALRMADPVEVMCIDCGPGS